VYKKGDLFFLNERGKILYKEIGGENGIIMKGPYRVFESPYGKGSELLEYDAYDILINGILFREVPIKFFERVTINEESSK
jgi:hypothetical protein